jgi:hypothetical protein
VTPSASGRTGASFPVAHSSTTTSPTMSVVASWLRQNTTHYAQPDVLHADVLQALDRWQTIRPKTDVYSPSTFLIFVMRTFHSPRIHFSI